MFTITTANSRVSENGRNNAPPWGACNAYLCHEPSSCIPSYHGHKHLLSIIRASRRWQRRQHHFPSGLSSVHHRHLSTTWIIQDSAPKYCYQLTLIRRLIFRTVAATWCKSQGKSCSTKWRSVTTCALSSRTRERVRERPSSGPYATTTGNAAKFTGAMLWVLLSKITIGQINPAEFTYLFFFKIVFGSKLCLHN